MTATERPSSSATPSWNVADLFIWLVCQKPGSWSCHGAIAAAAAAVSAGSRDVWLIGPLLECGTDLGGLGPGVSPKASPASLPIPPRRCRVGVGTSFRQRTP
eukprot:5730670-Prymnesium_polylepis.1